MKRTIVCMLLALSVSSSLYQPQIVLAAEQSEKPLKEQFNTGASENTANLDEETISTTQEDTKPQEESTPKEDSKPEEEQSKVSITVNENLDILSQKLKNPFKEEVSSGRYLLNEDLIFVGYLDSSKG